MDRYQHDRRRRSQGWVRRLGDREVHALALHLRGTSFEQDLTKGQLTLWAQLISELEYRRRRALRQGPPWVVCSCDLCMPPDIEIEY